MAKFVRDLGLRRDSIGLLPLSMGIKKHIAHVNTLNLAYCHLTAEEPRCHSLRWVVYL